MRIKIAGANSINSYRQIYQFTLILYGVGIREQFNYREVYDWT